MQGPGPGGAGISGTRLARGYVTENTLELPSSQTGIAMVVGAILPGEDPKIIQDDLAELESLLGTLGVEVAGKVIQRRQKLNARCLLGEGKVAEIAELACEKGSDLVVFDRDLSPPQVRNLEKMTGCRILDRAGVILEIFDRHARSSAAKTQVEIARLEYLLPRMSGAWTHFHRQRGGGVRSRGMGEKQIEVDRRRARERIARLQRQLESIRKEKQNQRKARTSELKVALVGYTNSGKTTLMNAMTHADLEAKDVLFATLDANVRTLDPSTRPRILMSDTVGFIRKLPHSLVESFKSTLDEVLEADLLLHVVDVSHPKYKDQIETTEAVLDEIGAGDIPTMMVFNKMDQLEEPKLANILQRTYPDSLSLSAFNVEDVKRLRSHLFGYFERGMVQATLAVPPRDQGAMSLIYNSCLILSTDYTYQHKAVFEVRAASPVLARLEDYVV